MSQLRNLTTQEIELLTASGSSAQMWDSVMVASDFAPSQIQRCRFEGRVEIHSAAQVVDSTICDYSIREGARVEGVGRLERRGESRFGGGVRVATVNECGGREVVIYEGLTAQVAYVMAMYRHRHQTINSLEAMIERQLAQQDYALGVVGERSRVAQSKIVRNVKIGADVCVEGASMLSNGTIAQGGRVGVDVKAYDFICAEDAKVDNGVVIERCFVGEKVVLDKGFSATDSLFFGASHCENGEAAAIFAGPYTVSHHKSTLLIAGIFSFFNAGSGTNQSNHLFKSGAVHQAVHPRGCKFASDSYVMAPAREGAFTMILGRHTKHHDTIELPYSYLLEQNSRSVLMPGANLASYGTVRDVEKWAKRDSRRVRRDVISYDEFNPYIGGWMFRAVDRLNILAEESPEAELYNYNGVQIKGTMLKRGVKLYTKAIVATLGRLLAQGERKEEFDGEGKWVDLGGQFIAQSRVEDLLMLVDRGYIESTEELDEEFRDFEKHYPHYAHSWAWSMLGALLGREPEASDVADAIAAGERTFEELRRTTDADREQDGSLKMAIGYGVDSEEQEDVELDFRTVRGL